MVALYGYLKTLSAGTVVTRADILRATGWQPITLTTYLNKNKLAKLLVATAHPDEFRVLVDGPVLREEDVAAALTQVTERPVPVAKGDRVVGERAAYGLVRECGEGAVGRVWEARTEQSGVRVAIKFCSPRPDLLEPTLLSNVRERFRKEARLSPRVSHPAIIEYLDAGVFNDAPFLVMELAERSLLDVLRARQRLTTAESLVVVARVLEALGWLHSQSCVHRDVKPANILLTARGYVLGDLGIVRWGDLSKSFTGAGTITRASVQLGSWFYMAPEQLDSAHDATHECDVYSLGIAWIEMLTGEAPPPQKVAAGRVHAPSGVPEVDALIARMTSYEPSHRPSVEELVRAVASLQSRAAAVG